MNIDPNGPIGIDDPEDSIQGEVDFLEEDQLRRDVRRLEEQLSRKVKREKYLEQQVDRLVKTASWSRQEEQNRRQEILKELAAEKKRRQEAEMDACVERHRASEIAFLAEDLEAELQALTGYPRDKREVTHKVTQQNDDKVTLSDSRDLEKSINEKLVADDICQLRMENTLLRQQVEIHRDDFDREHKEKEKVLRLNQQLQTELDQLGREVTVTRSRLGKLETDKEALLSDNRVFRESLKGKDYTREDTVKKPDFYEDILLNKMSGNRYIQNDVIKPPLHLDHLPPNTPQESNMAAREWQCSRCTLLNRADREFCEACGQRQKETRHLHRQKSAPVSGGWMGSDAYLSTAYR